ncbi:MAG: hypothetical protein KBA71_00710 [Opitutaceae bacterium]|nr:hypothetical protein [Opitutaceae bacterium]
MDRKQQRALHGPGWTEVILGAGLSLIAGMVLAFAWLVFKPVVVAKELAETAPPGSVFYYPGATGSTASRAWMRKRQIFLEGLPGNLVLTEEELNAWASDAMKPASPETAGLIVPGQINFRVADSTLQIASPTTVNLLGVAFPVIIQARGTFVQESNVFTFEPQVLYLGSLATHRLPGFAARTLRYLAQSHPMPQEISAAWKKLSAVSIEGKELRLTLP